MLECDRLGEVVECAGLKRRDGVLGTAERGDHGYGHVERLLRDVLDDSQSLAIGQVPVGEAEVVRVAIEHPQRFADGLGARRVEAHSRQRHFEQFEQIRLVIDDAALWVDHGFCATLDVLCENSRRILVDRGRRQRALERQAEHGAR